MLRFISWGSGSSGNCYLLYTDTDYLMIDAGVGFKTLKKYCDEYGISLFKVKNIIVTHDHADHVKNVGRLSRDFNLPVYATPEAYEGIKRNYCVKVKVPQDNFREIAKNVTINIGEFEVTPFSVPHDSADNVGYMIKNGGISFCLMTDIGHVTDEMAHFIHEADYLVIEANHDVGMLESGIYPRSLKERVLASTGHLSNDDCAEALGNNAGEQLKHIWLCHLSEENNHPTIAEKTIEQCLIAKGFDVGGKLKVEVLKRKAPSGVFEL